MATQTTNLHLTKPDGSEKVNIATINTNMDTIDTYAGTNNASIINLAEDIGVVVNGNKTKSGVTAAVGQYVILKNSTISNRVDGLYTAAKAIPANTAIDASYLTAVSGGGLNALNANISNVNSKVDAQKTIFVQLNNQTIAGSPSSAETTTFDLSSHIPSGYSIWSAEVQIRDGSSFYNLPWIHPDIVQATWIERITNISVIIKNKADWSGNRSVTFTLHCKKN